MERPLFLPLASLIAGLSLAGLYAYFLPEALLLPLLVISLGTVFLRKPIPFLISLCLIFFFCGNLSVKSLILPELEATHIANSITDQPVTIEGIIDSRPEATELGCRLYLRVERLYAGDGSTVATGRLLLYIGEGRVTYLSGDRVRFVTRLHKPRNYGLPGEFDSVRYLAYREVFATAFVKGADDLILTRAGVGYRLQRQLDLLAAGMGRFIGKAVPTEEGSILRALLLGERGYVSRKLEDAYSRTGVNHILSISGFHVGIIALFVFQLLLAVGRTSEFLALRCNLRKSILVITLPVIVFYLFLSGTAPATTRSVVMIAAYVVALMLEREVEPVNSLLLAAMLILGLTPAALFEVSFQLSFLALWGIVILTPLFMAPFSGVTSALPRKLLLFLMASAAATVATMFPVAFYFHRVSFTGLISNFVVVPLMGYGSVVLGFSALPFIYIAPFLARLLLAAAAFLVKISDAFILFLAGIPPLPLINPTRLDLFLFYLLLVILTVVTAKKARLYLSGGLSVVFIGTTLLASAPDAGRLNLTFFSVGQGEATLITFPGGKRMLVDGGGSVREGGVNVGERLLAPALWSMGVREIDYMVLSHNHPDHLQGLLFIADNFKVGEFWESGVPMMDSEDYALLKRTLAARRVPVRRVNAATPAILIDGARIEFLSPDTGALSSETGTVVDQNNDSLVFRLVFRRGAVLFTGDIGAAAEEQLLISPQRLRSNVLKIAHHGSRFSSSLPFLTAVSPETAVISAGYGNSFHLPAEETLARLQAKRIKVYRTDQDGTIRLTYDLARESFSVTMPNWHFN
jgi:competence protein ComEC